MGSLHVEGPCLSPKPLLNLSLEVVQGPLQFLGRILSVLVVVRSSKNGVCTIVTDEFLEDSGRRLAVDLQLHLRLTFDRVAAVDLPTACSLMLRGVRRDNAGAGETGLSNLAGDVAFAEVLEHVSKDFAAHVAVKPIGGSSRCSDWSRM